MMSGEPIALSVRQEAIAAIAEQVARSLASSMRVGGAYHIQTPLLYPSGSSVVVRIDGSSDRFFVSDFGMGYEEVSMLTSALGYGVIARALIRGTGVGFDNRSFFVAEATSDDLVGVVSAIANCSQRAVIETVIKHEVKKYDSDRAILIERLEFAFGKKRVERDIVIRGASLVDWEVTAQVVNDNVMSIFDYAKAHKNSVSSTVAKFHDIARLEHAPRRLLR